MEREHRTYAQAVEDIARDYVRMVALNEELDEVLRDAVSHPTFDELCDRRGQHERAAAARRLWRERGVSA
ncbi:hypothetical protein [Actinotalea ferrariae]|nr:hypothetical protein [Actinotalea ferrariae]